MPSLVEVLFVALMLIICAVFYGIIRMFGSWIKTDMKQEKLTCTVWAICIVAAMPVTATFVDLLEYGLKWLAGMPV